MEIKGFIGNFRDSCTAGGRQYNREASFRNLEVKCLFFVQEFSNTKDTKYTKF